MRLLRLVVTAAAAAGVAYCFKGRGPTGLPVPPRLRLALGGGMGGAVPAASPVAETVWTPSDPGTPAAATGGAASASPLPAS